MFKAWFGFKIKKFTFKIDYPLVSQSEQKFCVYKVIKYFVALGRPNLWNFEEKKVIAY